MGSPPQAGDTGKVSENFPSSAKRTGDQPELRSAPLLLGWCELGGRCNINNFLGFILVCLGLARTLIIVTIPHHTAYLSTSKRIMCSHTNLGARKVHPSLHVCNSLLSIIIQYICHVCVPARTMRFFPTVGWSRYREAARFLGGATDHIFVQSEKYREEINNEQLGWRRP